VQNRGSQKVCWCKNSTQLSFVDLIHSTQKPRSVCKLVPHHPFHGPHLVRNSEIIRLAQLYSMQLNVYQLRLGRYYQADQNKSQQASLLSRGPQMPRPCGSAASGVICEMTSPPNSIFPNYTRSASSSTKFVPIPYRSPAVRSEHLKHSFGFAEASRM